MEDFRFGMGQIDPYHSLFRFVPAWHEVLVVYLILKEKHYLGKSEFEAIQAVIQDAFLLDFTFFIWLQQRS